MHYSTTPLRLLAAAATLALMAACSPDAQTLPLPAVAQSPPLPDRSDAARIAASIPADGVDSSVPDAAAVFAAEDARSAALATTPVTPPTAFDLGTRQPAMSAAQESGQMPMPGQANDHSVAATAGKPAASAR